MTTVSEIVLEKAAESDLERVLNVLGVDPAGMSYNQKRDAVVLNFTLVDGWYFNRTVYSFQVEEIIRMVLTAQQMETDLEEYVEWVDLHNQTRVLAIAAAASQGFTYTFTGKMIEPSTGTITGVVGSPETKASTITLSATGDSTMLAKGRISAMVNELISVRQTDNDGIYNMNFNGVEDPVFMVSKFTDGFSWETGSIYDWVFLYSYTQEKEVVFSELSQDDIKIYLKNPWFRTIMLSDAVARYKERYVHGRYSASKRMYDSAEQRLLQTIDYVNLMGDEETDG